MNSDPKISTLFSLVMVVATATLGWFSFNDKGPQRVADTRTLAEVPAAEQNVIARLWEDPLQAIQADVTKQNQSKADVPQPAEDIHLVARVAKAVAERAAKNNICLMVIPVPDTPFPDDLEVRLRLRYAIQMAMSQENYAPANRNYLGYFRLESNAAENTASTRVGRSYVPYEWFITSRPSLRSEENIAVLILWLPESLLNRDPLGVLARLRETLYPVAADTTIHDRLAGVFVIGPRTSDTLNKMVSAAPEQEHPSEGGATTAFISLKNKLCIFSPQSTTPDALLGLGYQDKSSNARKEFARRLHLTFGGKPETFEATGTWRYFHNFIVPDDQLTDLLVVELGLRGLDLRHDADKILVLAEADTAYGRSLPVALQASLESYRSRSVGYFENENDTSTTSKILYNYKGNPPDDPQLKIYRYLRGLDQQKGQEGISKTPARANPKSPEELLSEALTKQGPMALGESQLDYADRLADDIKHMPDSGSIKAVGVLGGDIYDKLILLRSLRSKFPGAVFFTTDIDARLWHPDHLSFTRNMVVASAYDIKPDRGLNYSALAGDALASSTIAPFRDVYQVAVFRACRAAIRKAGDSGYRIEAPPSPQIFELGKNGAVLLPPARKTSDFISLAAENRGEHTEWLSLSGAQKKGLGLLLGGLAVAALLWVGYDWFRYRNWSDVRLTSLNSPSKRWITAAMVGGAVVVSFGIIAKFLGQIPGGEPWAWNEGVSVWPTEILRLLVVVAVVAVLIWAWQYYIQCRKKLIENFFPRTEISERPLTQSKWMGFATSWPRTSNEEDAVTVSAVSVFSTYLAKAGWWGRAVRVSALTIAYLLLAIGVVYLIDNQLPDRPHIRGDIARGLDALILSLSTVSFLILLFYVMDAVWLSAQLLRSICGPVTDWPEALLDKHQGEFSVRREDLSGYLDVKFAAQKSKEVGKLVFFPFLLQFVFILSRNSYFDNWTWPRSLILIFGCNIFLACSAWAVLRDAAQTIRKEAVERLQSAVDSVECEIRACGSTSNSRDKRQSPSTSEDVNARGFFESKNRSGTEEVSRADGARTTQLVHRTMGLDRVEPPQEVGLLKSERTLKERRQGLRILQRKIENERQGAYAQFFQDPALIAMVLPTGLCGILIVLFRALFGAV